MRSFQTKSRLTHKEKPKKSNRDTAKRIRKAIRNQSDGRTTRGGSNISDYFTSAKRNLAKTRLKRIHNSIVNAANRYNEQALILNDEDFPDGYPHKIKNGRAIFFHISPKFNSDKLAYFEDDTNNILLPGNDTAAQEQLI
jgi:hypothetical protein